ncbi:MAG: hypothetical protein HZB43_03750 [candidate division Zixibacteria bacterium]|nr:hypothetical protein [candidate division Zixibacteria bacterium]
MSPKALIAAITVTALLLPISTLGAHGRIVDTTIAAPSLANNLYDMPARQPISVYLPPSYDTSSNRYPVVYFLTGFGDALYYYTMWSVYQGFSLQRSMDTLIAQGTIGEMIVVIPNGRNFMMGSFYANSAVTGNWEDFISKDLVRAIDTRFRTLPQSESRGIGGHSMGGYGAIYMGMCHADVFGGVYALSPGLAAPGGIEKALGFADSRTLAKRMAEIDQFAAMPEPRARTAFISHINYLLDAGDYDAVFSYAYGSVFSPDPRGKAPFIDFPFRKTAHGVEKKAEAMQNYDRGFGDLASKVEHYRGGLLRLKCLGIDIGTRDENPWIIEGCNYFGSLLDSAGVPHKLVKYDGSHNSHIRQRIEEHLLPELSKAMKFAR